MEQMKNALKRRFDSDAVLVNYYPRVFPAVASDGGVEAKIKEYKSSVMTPAEILLKEFLSMGQEFRKELEEIWRTEDKKLRGNLKRSRLGAASISATFKTRDVAVPLEDKIKHYNSIIALDFDDVEDLQEAKARVAALPYVWYVGDSASRRGFFAIVPVATDDYRLHGTYFDALQREMAALGLTVDKSCRDVTRLRFVSLDDRPYFNEDCELYELPESNDEEPDAPEEETEPDTEGNRNLSRALAYAEEWERKEIPLDDYDDWRTVGMALSSLGEDGWPLFDKVSKFGKSYRPEENRKKYDGFLKDTRSIGLGTFFYKCHEYGVIPPKLPHYESIPFPMEVFPEQIREIIRESHDCLNFVVDHIAASLLFAASVAVGNSVIVEIKNEWTDKAVLFMAIVGKPGSNKSAPLRYALNPLAERDRKEFRKYEKQRAAYEEAMRSPAKERKNVPEEPEYRQTVLSDFTTEVLVRQHKINPRSLAVYVDELIGFIKNFNKYRAGNDEQVWTQLFNGGSVIVNRVSSQPLNIENTCIGVIGTIQPGLLGEFAKGKIESGFVDRWLFVFPDVTSYPKLNEQQMPRELTKRWDKIVEKLLAIEYNPEAKPVKFARDAMRAYTQWFNALADQKNASSASFAEMATKMERYCVRFAIVLEALKCVCEDKAVKSISLSSVKGSIDLCYYFISCALKARKKFYSNPLDDMTEVQRKVYNELPISFSTAEAVELGTRLGMKDRTLRDWLKSNYFRHVSHGQWEKRYK